jgi:S1-C subfamily serine protease
VSVADSTSRPDALVVTVRAGGAAVKAGIGAGDAIVKINGAQISNVSDLATILAGHQAGDKVTVAVTGTDGNTRQTTVTLGQLPGGR